VTKDKVNGIYADFSGGTTFFGTLGGRANLENGTSLYFALTFSLMKTIMGYNLNLVMWNRYKYLDEYLLLQ
jgi:hypothetical protein